MRNATAFVEQNHRAIDAAQHQFLIVRAERMAAHLRLQRNRRDRRSLDLRLVHFIHANFDIHLALDNGQESILI